MLTVWRSNLLGSSGKGHEYFLKHLLGTTENAVRAEESPPELRPREVVWRDQAPEGKLDLLTTIDFRMTSNALFSDVVLPAATWYEKYDLSSTDLHPFVHTFNQAIPPPWEAKSDWDAFGRIAQRVLELAERHLGARRDLVAAPLLHDTPDEIAQPLGEVRDWSAGECEPIPGGTMPKLIVVERDYPHVGEQLARRSDRWSRSSARRSRAPAGSPTRRSPSCARPTAPCAAAWPTAGRRWSASSRRARRSSRCRAPATGGWRWRGSARWSARPACRWPTWPARARATGSPSQDAQVQPRTVITSPEWSGIEAHGRRYAPFTINVEREKPWHTLSGRQHFYLDHAWMLELGRGPAGVPPAAAPPRDLRRPGRRGRVGTARS